MITRVIRQNVVKIILSFHLYSLIHAIHFSRVKSLMGFPGGSSGKEPTCNAGDIRDVGLIPGLGRSPGGGHSNPV